MSRRGSAYVSIANLITVALEEVEAER